MTNSLSQEKVIPFTAEKKVNWLPIKDGIAAYKEDIFFNNELFSSKEGLALVSDIENAHHLNEIPAFKKMLGQHNQEPVLVENSLLEFIRKNPLNVRDNAQAAFPMVVDKPYTYLQENSLEDVTILFLDFGSYEVYDLELNLVPQGIYFGYISQHINNYYYDLEVLLEAIKDRPDVWIDKTPTSVFKKEEAIKDIPYYNSEGNKNRWIEFIWSPSDEDFAIIKDDLADRYNRYQLVVSKIFGVDPIREF